MQMVSNHLLLRYDDVMILSEEDNGDENEGIEVNRLQPVICSTASDVSNDIFVKGCYPIYKKISFSPFISSSRLNWIAAIHPGKC